MNVIIHTLYKSERIDRKLIENTLRELIFFCWFSIVSHKNLLNRTEKVQWTLPTVGHSDWEPSQD